MENIFTIGMDKVIHRYGQDGAYLSSTILDGVPVAVEKNDNALLIIFEAGVSILNLNSNAPETLPKAQSVSWNGSTMSAASWKAASLPSEKNGLELNLDNARSIASTNNIIEFFKAGRPTAKLALYPDLEWILAVYPQGYFTGSRLSTKYVRVTEGPKVSRDFTSDDNWLISPSQVASVLMNYRGGAK